MTLLFIGAPLALAAGPLGISWLFPVGLGLLVIALALPTREGETLGDKLRGILRHLPGIGR